MITGNDVEPDEGFVEALQLLSSFVENPHLVRTFDWPSMIDGFQVLDELAWSGQAVALLAYESDLKRHVVLKMYYRSTSDAARQSILDEGQKLAKISNQYVARCFGTGQYAGCPYLVLEYIDGATLSDIAGVSQNEAARIVRDVARGLSAIHDQGIVHCDVKPSNIVVDKNQIPHLIDLGSATEAGAINSDSPSTVWYLSPECASQTSGFDRRKADIFSLGGVLYFLLTRRAPFHADTKEHALQLCQTNCYAPLAKIAPSTLAGLVETCERCMALDPRDRFADADEVEAALELMVNRTQRSSWFPAIIATTIALCVLGGFALVQKLGTTGDVTQRETPETPKPLAETDDHSRLSQAVEREFRSVSTGRRDDSVAPMISVAMGESAATPLEDIERDSLGRMVLQQPVAGRVTFTIESQSEKYPLWVQISSFTRQQAKWTQDHVTMTGGEPTLVCIEAGDVEVVTDIEPANGQTEYLVVVSASGKWDSKEFVKSVNSFLLDGETRTHRGVGSGIRFSIQVVDYVVKPNEHVASSSGLFNVQDPEIDFNHALQVLKDGHVNRARELATILKKQAAKPKEPDRSLTSNADYLLKLCELGPAVRKQMFAAGDRFAKHAHPMGSTFQGEIFVLENDYRIRKEHLGDQHLKTAESLYLLSLHQFLAAEQDADVKAAAANQLWDVRTIFHDQLGVHARTCQVVEWSSMLLVSKDEPGAMRFAEENHILAVALHGPDSRQVGEAMVQKAAAMIRNSRWVDGRQTCIAANHLLKDAEGPLKYIGLMTMGQILQEENDHERAINYFERAAKGFAGSAQEMEFLGFAATSQRLRGNHVDARAAITRVRKTAKALPAQGYTDEEVDAALSDIEIVEAMILLDEGETEDSVRLLTSVLKKSLKRPGTGQVDVVRRELAFALTGHGEFDAAAKLHTKSIENTTIGRPLQSVQGLALCYEAVGHKADAFSSYNEAFSDYLRLAEKLSNQQSTFQRFKYTERLKENLAGLLRTGAAKESAELFKFVFDAKGSASRALSQQYLARRRGRDNGVTSRYEELVRDRAALFEGTATRESQNGFEKVRSELEDIEKEFAGLVTLESSLRMEDHLASLADDTVIIDIVSIDPVKTGGVELTAQMLACFVIFRHNGNVQIKHVVIPDLSKDGIDWTSQIRKSRGVGSPARTITNTTDGTDQELALKRISETLQPAFALIPDVKSNLVVCPDAGLHQVPWAALANAGRRLVESFSITFSESARDYLLRKPGRSNSSDRVLIVGGLEFNGAASPLPESLAEAKQIMNFYSDGKSTLLSGLSATEVGLRSRMEGSSVVHLATHARYGLDRQELYSRNPLMASCVVISEGDKILGEDIASWDLSNTQLIVLSACQGAAGESITGEGCLSLERSLRFAGVKTVISSQVKVDDSLTKGFMIQLHEKIRSGLTPSKALRAVQLLRLKKPVGEWANWRASI